MGRDYNELREIVERLSDVHLKELCVQALRDWRTGVRAKTTNPVLSFSRFAEHLFQALPITPRRPPRYEDPKAEDLVYCVQHPWMLRIVEFGWWLIRAGLAIPGGPSNSGAWELMLTRAGLAFADGDDGHILVPGAVARLRDRCPTLPEAGVVLLEDARTCIEHGLTRAAIAMLGVALETVVDAAFTRLIEAGLADPPRRDAAWSRIDAIRRALVRVYPETSQNDDRAAATAALDLADDLRRRRNHATHATPAIGFDDRGEAEELFASTIRKLPDLWAVTRAVTP